MPRVTVVIATYNWSSVLPYSIGSVLDQTYRDFELLVVGDHCTDDSAAVVGAIDDPRVRWIDLPERFGHQSGPNNEGIRAARGEYIAYLGHDDLWMPYHLEEVVRALDGGADLVHARAVLIGAPRAGLPPEISLADVTWRPPSATAHRTAVIDRVGGWRDFRELNVSPELDLWTRIEAAGFKIADLPRVSALKFPAGWRKNVYRERPSHEQAAWLQRIRSEPDLEQVEFAHLTRLSNWSRAIRLLSHPSLWLAFFWRARGSRIRAWQRFKGL